MLKPSGGFFKKLFSPERMAKMKKTQTPISRPAPRAPMADRRERRGGVLGRAMARKEY